MNRPDRPLPPEVIAILRQGDRQGAIELLREQGGMDEDNAREAVDDYLENNPPVRLRGASIVAQNRRNGLIWFIFIVLMAGVYLLIAG